MRIHHKAAIGLSVVAAVLIAARLALPGWARDFANDRLSHMGEDYSGHMEAVDIHLWRGAYTARDFVITKTTGRVPAPLLQAPAIDIALSWRDLFHGAIVARVVFDRPEINFVDGRTKADSQSGSGVDWRAQLEQMIPMRLDEVRVTDGTLRFRNFTSTPQVDVRATDVRLTIQNLTNVRDKNDRRPASMDAHATVMEQTPVEAHGRFDPFTGLDDFALDLRMAKIDLVRLNDLLRAYLYLDVAAGNGEFVTQLDVRDRKVTGYIKPLFKDIQVVDWKQDLGKDNPLKLAWKTIAGAFVAIFKNHSTDQFATRTEISGSLDNPSVSTFDAILAILHNAFVKALTPGFEHAGTK